MSDQKFIKMRRADWEKWDKALRSGEYQQGPEELVRHNDYDGTTQYCCLGVLECALDGKVENNAESECDQLPTKFWLEKHNIEFASYVTAEGPKFGERAPFLPKLGKSAAEANDDMDYTSDDDVAHKYDFIKIADAIKDTVEFID